jgi:glutamate racemase
VSFKKGPIGIFDSGVGGLSVVRELYHHFNDENVLYLADQAHVPYGGRSLSEIRSFASEISNFLHSSGCRAILMACNVSSATALKVVQLSLSPIPVIGMISGAAYKAAELPSPKIGILATEGTVQTEAYPREILHINPWAYVQQVSCPRFVPLVENGMMESEEAEAAAREYLYPLAKNQINTIILGCTHYPFLLPVLERVSSQLFENSPLFIDPAVEAIRLLEHRLPDIGYGGCIEESLFLTTGDITAFKRQLPFFLGKENLEVGKAEWHTDTLRLPVPLSE